MKKTSNTNLNISDKEMLTNYLLQVKNGDIPYQQAATEIYQRIPNQIWTICLHSPHEVVKGWLLRKRTEEELTRGIKEIREVGKKHGLTAGINDFGGVSRTIGYTFSKEEAIKLIEESESLDELWYYEYVIVENYAPDGESDNIPGVEGHERYFFKLNKETGKFIKCDSPEWSKNVCCYGMG